MTKEHLERENAVLRQENEALRDIFTAVSDASDAGRDANWLVGFIGAIATAEGVPLLRSLAKAIRALPVKAAPVITDSGRDCDQANPETGAHCHRGGDHGVHRDSNGDEWRTGVGHITPTCGARPYPAGSEGDDGTKCILPAGHSGSHYDGPALNGPGGLLLPADCDPDNAPEVPEDERACRCGHRKSRHEVVSGVCFCGASGCDCDTYAVTS